MAKNTVNEIERLIVTRVFDAPRALVWKAWTDLSTSCSGGDRKALPRPFVRWIFALEEDFSAA